MTLRGYSPTATSFSRVRNSSIPLETAGDVMQVSPSWLVDTTREAGPADTPPWEEPARTPPEKTEAFLRSEVAEKLGVRHLHEVVRSLDECFFSPTPDYPKVGVLCQRILCAAAEVVVRVYPKELSGVDPSTPSVAIHVLDSFFASRLGENLDEPGRKLTRTALVLSHDQVQLGTPGRRQAAACMESIRFVVSSLLVLL
ncbi:MAG: hypothetical protein ACKO3N_13315 [Verrucomicrobiota bacterium]